jgi:hypothetical protein
MHASIPPDDDPRFDQWVRDIGPLQELELELTDSVTQPTITSAIALVGATIGMGVALGVALALVLNAVTAVLACVLIGVGTVLTVGSLAYLVWRAV